MEKLRKQVVPASILLEALVAFSVFALIATLLLGHIADSRREQARILRKEEALSVAQMALQTNQETLSINGVEVRVEKSSQGLWIYEGGEVLLHVEK